MRQISTLTILFLLCSYLPLSAQYIWSNQSRSTGSTGGGLEAADIAQDASGNSYVFAEFGGNVALDSLTFNDNGTVNDDGPLILVKYGPSGEVKWATPISGKSSNIARAVAVDASGNVYVCGQYTQTNQFTLIDFGNGITLTGNPSQSVFLAMADTTGTFQWARVIQASDNSGQQYADPRDLLVHGNDVFLTGSLKESVSVDGTTYNANNEDRTQMFIARYKTNGDFQWLKHTNNVGQFPSTEGHDLVLANNTSFYLLGTKNDSVNWNGSLIPEANIDGLFLANFDFDGNLNWASSMATSGSVGVDPYSVGVDQHGHAYTILRTAGHTTIGDTSFQSEAGQYLVSFAQDGRRRFARRIYSDGFGLGVHHHITTPGGITYTFGEYVSANMTFAGDVLPTPLNFGTYYFVSAMDNKGNILGATTLMDSTVNGGGVFTTLETRSASLLSDGSLSIIAKFEGRAIAGNDTLDSEGLVDQSFILKFNPVGLLNISTATEKTLVQRLNVFPNPTRGKLWINGLENEKINRLSLVDIKGKKVWESHNHSQLDISSLPSGYYFFHIHTTEGIAVKKLIKY